MQKTEAHGKRASPRPLPRGSIPGWGCNFAQGAGEEGRGLWETKQSKIRALCGTGGDTGTKAVNPASQRQKDAAGSAARLAWRGCSSISPSPPGHHRALLLASGASPGSGQLCSPAGRRALPRPHSRASTGRAAQRSGAARRPHYMYTWSGCVNFDMWMSIFLIFADGFIRA